MANYLDSTGLTYLWGKIKAAIAAHKATVTQTVTTGTELAEVDGVKIYAPEASGGGGTVYAATLNSVMATVDAAFDSNGYMTARWQTIGLRIQANGHTYDAQALAYMTYNKSTGLLSARVHDFVGHTYSGTTGYTIQPARAQAATGLFTIAGIPNTDAASFESGLLVIKTVLAAASAITTVPAFNVIETQQKTA